MNDITPGESYLYVVEFIGHGVKVGITANPDRRFAQHRRDAAAFDRAVGRTWLSPVPHGNARDNERALKLGARREYLDRPFDECVTQAEEMAFIRLDPAEVERRSQAVLRTFQAILLGGVR